MSHARKAWLKGLASGFMICFILFVWSPEWLFGERRVYTETHWNQNLKNPYVSTPLVNFGTKHGDNLQSRAALSLFRVDPIWDITSDKVASVCISRAELDRLGLETWAADIQLENHRALLEIANGSGVYDNPSNRPFAMLRLQGIYSFDQYLQEGRFVMPSLLEADDKRANPYHFRIHFNELQVPDMADVLLSLTADYKVLPCDNLSDLTIYNRWKSRWTDSDIGGGAYSNEWLEKFD